MTVGARWMCGAGIGEGCPRIRRGIKQREVFFWRGGGYTMSGNLMKEEASVKSFLLVCNRNTWAGFGVCF